MRASTSPAWMSGVFAAFAAVTFAHRSFGQAAPPPPQPAPPPAELPPLPPSGAPSSGGAAPGAPLGSPPSDAPPANQQPGGYPDAAPPAYGQQPIGSPPYVEPPLPPKRKDPEWSVRFDLLNLIFGRVTGEVEYVFAPPLSLTVGPEYIFFHPSQDSDHGITANGAGVYGELGFWIEGRPLRGYFLKGHIGYSSITFHGPIEDLKVPETRVGALFGSQSIYGGWFTVSYGIGVAYDLQSQNRSIVVARTTDATGTHDLSETIPASGLFGNGFDLVTKLSLGGSF